MGVDLAVLSLAQHTIMDYGTFGLWAGLLAGGAILAPAATPSTPPSPQTWSGGQLPT